VSERPSVLSPLYFYLQHRQPACQQRCVCGLPETLGRVEAAIEALISLSDNHSVADTDTPPTPISAARTARKRKGSQQRVTTPATNDTNAP
jgi:hypothetical protein